MSIHLGILYHWSPKAQRQSIMRAGLEIARPTRTGDPDAFSAPWVCLGTTPSSAWGLILDPVQEGDWDLWQVKVRDGDHVTIRTDFDMPSIREVRVHNGLPADRVWWVGERSL